SLAVFLAHDLDYERIKRTSIGSVKTPLTSFKEDLQRGEFKPVGRWRDRFSPLELATFERLVGNYLMQLGYALSDGANHHASSAIKRKRQVYLAYYEFKQWAKVKTPLSRLAVDYAAVLIDK